MIRARNTAAKRRWRAGWIRPAERALLGSALVVGGALGGVLAPAPSPAHAQTVSDACPGETQTQQAPPLGGVLAWGRGDSGQLGSPVSTTYVADPTAASGLGPTSGVVAVAAGDAYSLALKADGTVLAWGNDDYGQLGDGSPTLPGVHRLVLAPVQVVGLGPGSGVIAIAAGGQHSLALKRDGSVWAWGDNASGDLGDTTVAARPVPVPVSGLGPVSGVIAIAAGGDGSLALKADGTVLAWGDRTGVGSLGPNPQGSTPPPRGVVTLGAGSQVVAIAAGGHHSMALKADGTVEAWGGNAQGELGTGTTLDSFFPAMVSLLGTGVVGIAAGATHSLALKSDGSVLAWGYGFDGELGTGTTDGSGIPVAVSGLGPGSGVVDIAAGNARSVARRSDGSLMAWGASLFGELGTGGTARTDTLVPTAVHGLGGTPDSVTGVQAVSAGGEHLLAVQSGLFVACAGNGASAAVHSILGPLTVVLRDRANHPISRVQVVFTAPATGPSATHAALGTVTSGLNGSAGLGFDTNDIAGSYLVTATATVGTGPTAATYRTTFSVTNLAGPPEFVTPTTGTPQSAVVGHAFAQPLTVTVQDHFHNVVPNQKVTFTAPATGASGTFAGGSATAAVMTDDSGVATAPFTANSSLGRFAVVASAGFIKSTATFELANTTGLAALITAVAGTPQTAAAGSSFAVPLRAQVKDAGGNLLVNTAVTFTAPASGASGTFSIGGRRATGAVAFTDATGVATAPPFTANRSSGTFLMLARAAGFDPAAVYSLTNVLGTTGISQSAPGAGGTGPSNGVARTGTGHAPHLTSALAKTGDENGWRLQGGAILLIGAQLARLARRRATVSPVD